MAHLGVLAAIPAWSAPLLVFAAALLIAVSGAAWFTRSLEDLSDRWRFSPGLLGLVSAVGANAPNYTASLTAFASRQPLVGQGIIVGSNIYNLAIILGIAVLVLPGRHGIALQPPEARDALRVAWIALSMALTTLLALLALMPASPVLSRVVLVAINLLTLGLFVQLAIHAVRRGAHRPDRVTRSRTPQQEAGFWASARTPLALALALGSVIVMVQAGQAVAADVHLSPAFLSLVVLAVATSLPNTVVAVQLARDGRAVTCVEEVLSSNGVNLALGSALPLLFWHDSLHDRLLLDIDTPLMIALTLVALLCVRAGRISRALGGGLILVYGAWVLMHVLA
jgi:cation:H+ antiporter